MPKTTKPLTESEIAELRLKDHAVWEHCFPTYNQLLTRLICDVSSAPIPEPQMGKIILKIRQVWQLLEPYEN